MKTIKIPSNCTTCTAPMPAQYQRNYAIFTPVDYAVLCESDNKKIKWGL